MIYFIPLTSVLQVSILNLYGSMIANPRLYHHDDLTFDPKKPRGAFNSYTAFRKRVEEGPCSKLMFFKESRGPETSLFLKKSLLSRSEIQNDMIDGHPSHHQIIGSPPRRKLRPSLAGGGAQVRKHSCGGGALGARGSEPSESQG